MCRDSFIFVPWLVYIWAPWLTNQLQEDGRWGRYIYTYVPWLIYICAMTHLYMCHDSFIYVPWLMIRYTADLDYEPTAPNFHYTYYITYTLGRVHHICVPWLIHICDTTYRQVHRGPRLCTRGTQLRLHLLHHIHVNCRCRVGARGHLCFPGAMTYSYICGTRIKWITCMYAMAYIFFTKQMFFCNHIFCEISGAVTYSYICVPRIICDMTRLLEGDMTHSHDGASMYSYTWHNTFEHRRTTFTFMTHHMYIYDATHLNLWHDSLTRLLEGRDTCGTFLCLLKGQGNAWSLVAPIT